MNNELIKIDTIIMNDQEVNTVDARELWYFLESKQDFSHWIKDRIEKYGFVDSQDFTIILSKTPSDVGGRPAKEYYISLDMAKELAMVENNEKGRLIRKYFIEVEKQYQVFKVPRFTRKQLAEMLLEAEVRSEELELQKLALEKKIEKDRPKVEFAETFQAANGDILVRQLAKMLSPEMSQEQLFDWYYSHKILISHNEAYQQYMTKGYFKVKAGTHQEKEKIVTHYTLMVTPKGQYWTWRNWLKEKSKKII